MKCLKKIKCIIFLLNIILVLCGVLFITSFLNKPSAQNDSNASVSLNKDNRLIEDLSVCKNNLFLAKNELERTKFLPDARKNIIDLMFVMRRMEKDIGKKSDFSNYCIEFFPLASRVPIVQEYVVKYKDKMFAKNCNFQNNNQIIQMILPFQLQLLTQQNNITTADNDSGKWYKKIFKQIKNCIVGLFIKSQITKSDLEIAVENSQYIDALRILSKSEIKQGDEFENIYNAISVWRDMQQMLDGTYEILRTNS